MIIRLHKDYFSIITTSVDILEEESLEETNYWCAELELLILPERNFLLVWECGRSSNIAQMSEWYDIWKGKMDTSMGREKTRTIDHMGRARRTWNLGLVLGDVSTLAEKPSAWAALIEDRCRETVKYCESALGHGDIYKHKIQSDAAAPSLSSQTDPDSRNDILDLLLTDAKLGWDCYTLYSEHHRPSPLLSAAQDEQISVVELLLESTQELPRDLLLRAAWQGYNALVWSLLKSGRVDIDMLDPNEQTPLSLAAQYGQHRIVRTLLEMGKPEVDVRDIREQTPLLHAARSGHEAVVQLLLDATEADPNVTDDSGNTPLSLAARYAHEGVAQLLLKSGKTNINTHSKERREALLHAASHGWETVLKFLLGVSEIEVDPEDKEGRTPLLLAARHGHTTVAKMLLETGQVNPDAESKKGEIPLIQAIMYGHVDVVRLLLAKCKVKFEAKDSNGGTLLGGAFRTLEEIARLNRLEYVYISGEYVERQSENEVWDKKVKAIKQLVLEACNGEVTSKKRRYEEYGESVV